MNGARSRYTVSPSTTTLSLSPESTETMWRWATWIAWFHIVNSGLATNSAILSWTNPVTADVRVGVRVPNRSTSCGGRPWAASASTASSASRCTSTYWKTVAVSRLVRALCTSGSETRGVIVRTNRSVSDLVVHPDRDACDGSECAPENDQHDRQQRSPAELPSRRARGRVERLDLAAQTKEFSAFIGGQRLPRGGLNRGRFLLGHRRHLRESSGDGSLAARTSAAITSPG